MTSQQQTTETNELAELLDGLVPTEYSPYFTIDSVEWSLELVREMRHGGNLPEAVNGLHYRAWTRIYQAPEGYVVVWSGGGSNRGVSLWTTPEIADAMRLEKANQMGVTPESAARIAANEHLHYDQRRMAEIAAMPPLEQAKVAARQVEAAREAMSRWATIRAAAVVQMSQDGLTQEAIGAELGVGQSAVAKLIKQGRQGKRSDNTHWARTSTRHGGTLVITPVTLTKIENLGDAARPVDIVNFDDAELQLDLDQPVNFTVAEEREAAYVYLDEVLRRAGFERTLSWGADGELRFVAPVIATREH